MVPPAREQRRGRRTGAVGRCPSCRCLVCSHEDSSSESSQKSGPRCMQPWVTPLMVPPAREQRRGRCTGAVGGCSSCRRLVCLHGEGSTDSSQKSASLRMWPCIHPMVLSSTREPWGGRRLGAAEESPSCRRLLCLLEGGSRNTPQKSAPRCKRPQMGAPLVSPGREHHRGRGLGAVGKCEPLLAPCSCCGGSHRDCRVVRCPIWAFLILLLPLSRSRCSPALGSSS